MGQEPKKNIEERGMKIKAVYTSALIMFGL